LIIITISHTHARMHAYLNKNSELSLETRKIHNPH